MNTKRVDLSAECIIAGDTIVHPATGLPTAVLRASYFPSREAYRVHFCGDAPHIWLGKNAHVKLQIEI